jgi:RNA polymerase sigma factor (sigma-70 family)
MTIDNPLADNSPDHEDQELVLRARSGDRKALEELVQRHQAWIYNIAVRMLYHPQDAEDATQEILIKVITRLSSFEGRSSFRTWLYRIVVNHVLKTKRGRVYLTWIRKRESSDDENGTATIQRCRRTRSRHRCMDERARR